MASGLLALLDDVAAIAKVAASSIDDVVAQSSRAGLKAAGVVIDDTAVTPRYVVGFAAERELPIVWRITLGSLRNKLIFLLPAALLLSVFAPWAITPLLMLGGLYLCYEGTEKILEFAFPHEGKEEVDEAAAATDSRALEDQKVSSAIRTDFILSAEIMAITLASLPEGGLAMRAVVLAVVAVLVTVGVYGLVALIVKADDIGVAMAASKAEIPVLGGLYRGAGRMLVKGMPHILKLLAAVGTVAMLWVGGGILVHGLAAYGIAAPEHLIADISAGAAGALPQISGAAGWTTGALLSAILGFAAGLVTVPIVSLVARIRKGPVSAH